MRIYEINLNPPIENKQQPESGDGSREVLAGLFEQAGIDVSIEEVDPGDPLFSQLKKMVNAKVGVIMGEEQVITADNPLPN